MLGAGRMEIESLSQMSVRYVCLGLALLGLATWQVVDFSLSPDDLTLSSPPSPPGRLVQEKQTRTSYRLRYVPPSRSPHQRTDPTMLKTFELAVGSHWKSTVQVMADRHQLALGLVVDRAGWVVTKASQLTDESLECRCFDGRRTPAELVRVHEELDIALLKLERQDLPPVVWHPENSASVGAWLATVSTSKTPVALGVVGVGPRTIPAARAVLGVSLGDAEEGAMVSMVIPGGGAYRAGIEEGDVIISINGAYLRDKDALLQKIAELRAGQRVVVGVNRERHQLTLAAQLMDISTNLFDPTEMEVNGSVSARSTGFSRVFQHDTVLAPHQCGGPLVDSRGRVVGLNIARAGRVNSYALPLDVAVPAIREMLTLAKQPVQR